MISKYEVGVGKIHDFQISHSPPLATRRPPNININNNNNRKHYNRKYESAHNFSWREVWFKGFKKVEPSWDLLTWPEHLQVIVMHRFCTIN